MRQQIWAAAFAAEYVRQRSARGAVSTFECWGVATEAAEAFAKASRQIDEELAKAGAAGSATDASFVAPCGIKEDGK